MKAARLRTRVTYANVTSTVALALALSTGGAYAAAQIGAGDIKDDAVRTRHIADGQVTKTDLKDGAVTSEKFAPSARTQIIEYHLGSRDFATELACVNLNGLTRSQIVSSVWTAQLHRSFDEGGGNVEDQTFTVPGETFSARYRVTATAGLVNRACVVAVSGVDETFDAVRLIRTVPTARIVQPD
jgi:hypothetical protein